MKVTVKDVEAILGNNGILLEVSDATYVGKLRIGRGTIEWCKGKTRIGNGTKIKWGTLIEFLESQ